MPFPFSNLNRAENLREILKLESFKACQHTNIPTKIIKENTNMSADILLAGFNDSVGKSNFPYSPKKENITTVFKKGDRNPKDNLSYHSSSISKILNDIFFVSYTVLLLSS